MQDRSRVTACEKSARLTGLRRPSAPGSSTGSLAAAAMSLLAAWYSRLSCSVHADNMILRLALHLLCAQLLLRPCQSMMRSSKDDHSKCGCPAVWQRQPRELLLTSPTRPTGRIFNGKPSRRGSWPWQVSLQLLHPKLGFIGHWCGGVLIDESWVLTAAHCVHNDLFNLPIGALWTAVVGEWELDSGGRGSARLPVERVILHERFENYVHDIALMKLARPAPLSKVVRTICLPSEASDDDGIQPRGRQHCVTSGWGRSGPSPSLSNALLEASVPLLELAECVKAYGKSVPIREGHLCAGNTDGSSGSCVGDSGGPLQCRRADGVWQLVGVTSFGSGCARPGYPDVYTKIQYYITWIRDTIANDIDG